MENKKDDHEVFGSYVAMEMSNLQLASSKRKLRSEIRNAISRVVAEDTTITDKLLLRYDEFGSGKE